MPTTDTAPDAPATREDLDTAVADIVNSLAPNPDRPTPGLGAARKVLLLMQRVDHIGKTGHHPGAGGGYKYRKADVLMGELGVAMRAIGLIGSTKILSTRVETRPVAGDKVDMDAHVHIAYTFTDPEDGSTHTVEGFAVGRDRADKGPNKAVSMALKYALLWALMLPVEPKDDGDTPEPEQREQADEAQQRTPQQRTPEQIAAERAEHVARAVALIGDTKATLQKLQDAREWCAQKGLLETKLPDGTPLGKAFLIAIELREHTG